MKRFSAILTLAALAIVTVATARLSSRQIPSDTLIAQRNFATCSPSSAVPFLYYAVTGGQWHCTGQSPRTGVYQLGAAASTTLGTQTAGLTDTTNAASGTTQNTEYTLNSVSLPANAFNANGRAVSCRAWASTAGNANAKNIKIYFGTTAVATVTGSTANAKDVAITLTALRTGASAQSAIGSIQVDTAVAPTMAVASATEVDTSAIVVAVKSANTAAGAASATGKGLVCEFTN